MRTYQNKKGKTVIEWDNGDGFLNSTSGDTPEAAAASYEKMTGQTLPRPIVVEAVTARDVKKAAVRKERAKAKSNNYERFLDYHQRNPMVYDEIVRMSREAMGKGYKKWSMQGALEIVRWFSPDLKVDTPDGEFRISNDMAAYYSRYIMMREPDLFLFFTVHQCPADEEMGWTGYVEQMYNPTLPPKIEPQTVGNDPTYGVQKVNGKYVILDADDEVN